MTVTYYVALNSPWSFLGGPRLATLAARADAAVDVRPLDIGRLFQATGGLPLPQRPKSRQDYRLWELTRWSRRLGLTLVLHPDAFPCDERLAAACVLALKAQGGDALDLATRLGGALWVDNRDVGQRAVVESIIAAAGLDAPALLAEAEAQADRWEGERQAHTDAAIAAGVFGVPTYIVGEEPFWGQDRLDFVAEALA
ncbi:2-hydroxychromene-2-carboxylate isomerase [Roseospira goensis]|nr:2-hydroxychromene-2-carboxylate isomerase [Roseospira goensis]